MKSWVNFWKWGDVILTLYTVGYEGVDVDTFLECLHKNKIEVLADVRQSPMSRKPGFSQKKLEEKTSSYGLVYKHFPSLGCPAKIRNRYALDADWMGYCKSYNLYLKSHPEAIEKISVFIENFSCALMCFEADPNRCHRLLIAQAVIAIRPTIALQNLHPSKNQVVAGQMEACFA